MSWTRDYMPQKKSVVVGKGIALCLRYAMRRPKSKSTLVLVMATHFLILANQYHGIKISAENRHQVCQGAYLVITSFSILDLAKVQD